MADNIVIDLVSGQLYCDNRKIDRLIVWIVGPDYPTMNSPELRPRFDTHVPRPLDQTSGQHDAHIIPKGLPGEGNLLVFDNNAPSGVSK